MAVQISNIVFLNLLYCYISVSSPKPPSQCNMKKDSYISFTLCNSRVISKWDLGKCRLCLEKMNPAMFVVGSVLSACWSPLLKWIKREEGNSTARALRKSHKIHIWVDHPIYLPNPSCIFMSANIWKLDHLRTWQGTLGDSVAQTSWRQKDESCSL